jgi:NADH dehydrogenase [ubiquinone] 1 alpha subcomplex assembly factor 7
MSGDKENEAKEETVEGFLGKLFDGTVEEEAVEPEAENQLAKKLRSRIKEHGPITLHDYMEACAADPEFGYYIVRDPFGAGGDFITAPDICQMFGELMGLWCVHVWAELGQPKNCKFIELGPGRGTLMSDALRAASLVPQFLQSVEVHFVETSAALRKVQGDQIRAQAEEQERAIPDMFWHDKLEDVPEGPSFIIANEFLDALPIRQFQHKSGKWLERMVALDDDDNFVFSLADAPHDDLQAFPAIHKQANEDDFLELCPSMPHIVKQIAGRADKHPLASLFIDYGYGEPALGDSFQAIKAHEFTDPLLEPGIADVTAHVDFSQLLHVAGKHGLGSSGAVTQRDFLIALGVRERAAQLMQGMENMVAAHQFISGFQRLIDAGEMGTLFKVVALTGADQPQVPGFDYIPDGKADFTME